MTTITAQVPLQELSLPNYHGGVDSSITTSILSKIGKSKECKLTITDSSNNKKYSYALKYQSVDPTQSLCWHLYKFHNLEPISLPKKEAENNLRDQNYELKPVELLNQITPELFVIKIGEKLNRKSSELMDAVASGNVETVEQELEKGINVNLALKGRSLLYLAVRKDRTEVVKVLLDAGASAADGQGLLDLAINSNNSEMVESLLTGGAVISDLRPLLNLAISRNNTEIVRLLMSAAGSKPFNDDDGYASSMLRCACDAGNCVIVELIASKCSQKQLNIKVNVGYSSCSGTLYSTPLGRAARAGRFDVCKALLSKGADVNRSFFDDQTLLMLAVKNASLEFVTLLINTYKADTSKF